jgi:hypothetical protein
MHTIPNVPKKDCPKNITYPVTILELKPKTLDI